MHYASVCAIIKDEDKDLMEWVNYHFAIGFEHILIYDNNSEISICKQLSDYVASGLVTVIDCPLTKAQQLSAYMNAIKYWGKNTKWLAFIDADEFVTPIEHNDIRDFLDNYIQFGGVGANWAMFGSNGHISRPLGGILENYTSCLGLNPHIKSIVQPSLVRSPKSAHHFTYKDGYFCVNEDGIPIYGFNSYPLANKIRINHYYYKSQQDFYEKIARGLGTQMKSGNDRSIQNFYSHLESPVWDDKKILRIELGAKKFMHMAAEDIKCSIDEKRMLDFESEIISIDNLLQTGHIDDAYKRCKILARYHDGLNLEIVHSKVVKALPKKIKILALIRERMQMEHTTSESLIQCYRYLADFYKGSGQLETAKNIEEWIS